MSLAKEIRVSNDSGANWYVLPGNTGDINFEGNQLEDTIFGAAYSSSETGLINWSVSANAMYRGFAGYRSRILRSGESTAMTDEALSQVGSSDTYEINDSTKSLWNWNIDLIVEDSGAAVDDEDIEDIDYLFGRITFASDYTVSGPVTVTGEYFPTAEYGRANSFSLTQSADTTDTTSFEVAQANGGFNTFRSTLLTADLELTAFYRTDNEFFEDLKAREEFVVEIDLAGNGETVGRGIYKVNDTSQSGDVGGDEEQNLNLTLSVPEGVTPFRWRYDEETNIPQGLRIVQEAWSDRETIMVQYLPEGDGNKGFEGEVIVTDASISSGVDEMVEADVSLQGTGECLIINAA